jgi:TadE-like protein
MTAQVPRPAGPPGATLRVRPCVCDNVTRSAAASRPWKWRRACRSSCRFWGTWEIARLVQVYQVVANAAREGARIAAQGQIINLTGAYTLERIMQSGVNISLIQ